MPLMTIKHSTEIYQALCLFNDKFMSRKQYRQLRAKYLSPKSFVKQAFDTRRINQNTEFNPRRNLQYYQRSEPFLDDKNAEKIRLLLKVKEATDEIRNEFIGEPEWLDSYSRILCNAIDQTLRVEQKDFDYSTAQLDYLSELLYVRYRLNAENLAAADKTLLKKTFLNKDEKLLRKGIFINYKEGLHPISNNSDLHKSSEIHKTTVIQQDPLIDQLFGNVKANKENKQVERSVTITIKDSILDDKKSDDDKKSEDDKVIKSKDTDIDKEESDKKEE